jgi:hypothetical protein
VDILAYLLISLAGINADYSFSPSPFAMTADDCKLENGKAEPDRNYTLDYDSNLGSGFLDDVDIKDASGNSAVGVCCEEYTSDFDTLFLTVDTSGAVDLQSEFDHQNSSQPQADEVVVDANVHITCPGYNTSASFTFEDSNGDSVFVASNFDQNGILDCEIDMTGLTTNWECDCEMQIDIWIQGREEDGTLIPNRIPVGAFYIGCADGECP